MNREGIMGEHALPFGPRLDLAAQHRTARRACEKEIGAATVIATDWGNQLV